MWEICFGLDDRGVPLGKNRFDAFRKRRPEEFRLLLSRAQSMISALDAGYAVGDVLRRGWVHSEKSGVFALDPGRSTMRLYCCLDRAGHRLFLLTVGDKKTQTADVPECARWAETLLGKE